MSERMPSGAVKAVAEMVGEKIHWIHDPVRAEDLARLVLKAALGSGEVMPVAEHEEAIQRLTDELNDVGCECSRMETDQLILSDALADAGFEGAINARSIEVRIGLMAARLAEITEAAREVSNSVSTLIGVAAGYIGYREADAALVRLRALLDTADANHGAEPAEPSSKPEQETP